MILNWSTDRIQRTAYGMSELAKRHENDIISNNLAACSARLESYGSAFATSLTDTDIKLIKYYQESGLPDEIRYKRIRD